MNIFTLKRTHSNDFGTFGVLDSEKVPFAVTLERPWKNNDPEVSCIPTGEYLVKRTLSPHFGTTFEVTGVPNRTNILFHKGNLDSDSKGCILLGNSFAVLNGNPGISSSGQAFTDFMSRLKEVNEFKLVITNA